MQDFRKLSTWQKAHLLTMEIYKASASFPKDEQFGLSSQMRRVCASIPANIAEGCGRTGTAELGRFLQIAQGSASELEYHLLLARDLKFLKSGDHENLSDKVKEVRKMLTTLIQRIKTNSTLMTNN